MAENSPPPNTLQYLEELPPAEFSREEIAILRKVNQKIAGAPDLTQTMQYLFEATKEICHCDRVSAAFADSDRQRVVCQSVVAEYDPVLLTDGYAEDLAGSSLERVIRDGRCRLIGDLKEYFVEHPGSRSTRILLSEGVRSSMTSPLKLEGRTIGLLFRSSRQPNQFTRHQVRIHLAITERLTQAIEKAYRIQQLARANEAYMELLGFVTHELKSPVASLVMTSNLLLDGTYGELQPAQRQNVDRIVFKGQYLLGLIRDYLNLSRLESGELTIHPKKNIDFIREVVEPAVDLVQPWLDNRDMTLEREFTTPTCVVECDPELMTIALSNLLNNAAKYGNKGGKIKLLVNCGPGRMDVSVWNEGPGFSGEDKQKLFRKFSRLDDPVLKKAKGTGVGLYTVWRIINQHAGKIIANSQKGRWAEFAFHIPRTLPPTAEPAEGAGAQ